jgi:hypothetical protein
MQTITTIGLDIARSVFQFTEFMPLARWSSEAAIDDVLRYTEPIPFGPFPVNGSTIEQLAKGVPLFSPIEGLEESMWKKNCSTCHKWDRQALCEQGASYAKNPRFALRHPHPYGGAYKAALMQWAKAGCQ